jgi:hypothetical protein
MPTQQFPIVAGTTASQVVSENFNRRYLYIKSYVLVPSTQDQQTPTLYVAFGVPATVGLNGEMEFLPGSEYLWNGKLPPLVSDLPYQYISVITNTGTIYGSIIQID